MPLNCLSDRYLVIGMYVYVYIWVCTHPAGSSVVCTPFCCRGIFLYYKYTSQPEYASHSVWGRRV